MPIETKSLRNLSMVAWQTGMVEVPSLGLRERHKMDKLQRIANAAIAQFGQNGYDATTLRDIARDADVALGTLSLYARDKRDLVLMIFNKLIPPLFERGSHNVDRAASLVDNMIALYEPCYRAYAGNPTLYRIVLGQIYNGPGSVHAEENDAIRIAILGHMGDIISHAIASGECRADADVGIQSRSFFYLYFTAVRVWLFQNEPDPTQGLTTLRTFFAELMRGCASGS